MKEIELSLDRVNLFDGQRKIRMRFSPMNRIDRTGLVNETFVDLEIFCEKNKILRLVRSDRRARWMKSIFSSNWRENEEFVVDWHLNFSDWSFDVVKVHWLNLDLTWKLTTKDFSIDESIIVEDQASQRRKRSESTNFICFHHGFDLHHQSSRKNSLLIPRDRKKVPRLLLCVRTLHYQ